MEHTSSVCHIVCAGEQCAAVPEIRDGDFIIAADGGLRHLQKWGIAPHLTVGDFDSLSAPPEDSAGEVITLPCEKDDTDLVAAIRLGLDRGYKNFRIYCALGGTRLDHTLAAISAAAYLADQGCGVILYGKNENAAVIKNSTLRLPARDAGYVSVFSHTSESAGVSIKGLKYSLEDAVLTNTFPLGVSNEFRGCDAEITVRDGILAVIFPAE